MVLSGDELLLCSSDAIQWMWNSHQRCLCTSVLLYDISLFTSKSWTCLPLCLLLLIMIVCWTYHVCKIIDFAWWNYWLAYALFLSWELTIDAKWHAQPIASYTSHLSDFIYHLFVGNDYVKRNYAHGCLLLLLPLIFNIL